MTWRPVKDVLETGWYWCRINGLVERDPVHVWRWVDDSLMFGTMQGYGPLEKSVKGAELYGPLTPPE